jgi:transposase
VKDRQCLTAEGLSPEPAKMEGPLTDRWEILDTPLGVAHTGRGKTPLAHDSPNWKTVYIAFSHLQKSRIWKKIHASLQ